MTDLVALVIALGAFIRPLARKEMAKPLPCMTGIFASQIYCSKTLIYLLRKVIC